MSRVGTSQNVGAFLGILQQLAFDDVRESCAINGRFVNRQREYIPEKNSEPMLRRCTNQNLH